MVLDELERLINEAEKIKDLQNKITPGQSTQEYNNLSEIWMNNVQIVHDKYLRKHALANRIQTLLFHRSKNAVDNLNACLISISKDFDFIDQCNGMTKSVVPTYQAKNLPEYDVFISHANKDKTELVDELNESLKKLGIKIFYDKESLEWGR